VSGSFLVKNVSESGLELEVVLSEFDPKKKDYAVHVDVECGDGHSDDVVSKNSRWECKQNIEFRDWRRGQICDRVLS
jgi:hypothetical protein